MPTISIKKDLLMQKLEKVYSDQEFDELCFQFGIELDEITSEKEVAIKENRLKGNESTDVIYKIDIPANRFDLLGAEGLVLALRIFLGKIQPPEFKVKPSGLQLKANDPSWPILMAAVVRSVTIDFQNLTDLVDKLGQTIGRKKTIACINAYDLDQIADPAKIVNADISSKTKNVFIQVKATDQTKARIALDTVVVALISSNNTYQAESVQIQYPDGKVVATPDLSYQSETIKLDYINTGLGLNLKCEEAANLLLRMGHKTTPKGQEVEVHVPPTRHDVIHKCDILEDVGIAYGYDNIPRTFPKNATIASQVPLNKLSDQLRNEVARCGYTEALNFALCSVDEISTLLNRTIDTKCLARIQNPKTIEFQVARTCLLPGLLKTINSNKKSPLPMKLFEIGDVVIADPEKDVGAKNCRHLAAIYYGKQTSGFELIHGLLDRVMQVLECPYIGEETDKKNKRGYYIESTQDGSYLPGRCAAVIYNGNKIGHLGILHPKVLSNFDLNHPSSSLEINLELINVVQ